ncbi:DciA family protein [Candidatus Tisiphia endosymbiont of Oplodontha viridula]|uniref:DciA family protein n=1 Tax=Candidatus Tisiphia endosymbiont of Oplodontha viridula TaxID=3077925 RepID=UPI0035C92B29
MKPLSHDINIIIRRIFGKQHPLLAEIMINWSKIVGPKFSSKTSSLKISSPKEKGQRINILHVQVENSSIALEISFHQQIIIERISVYLGFKAIHSLRTTIYATRNN